MSQTMFRGLLVNGFDYDKQAWVVNAKYVRCGHPEEMQCKCYGRLNEGEPVANILPSDALFIPNMGKAIDGAKASPSKNNIRDAVNSLQVELLAL